MENFEVLARRVKHLEDRGVGHQVEQRRQIDAGSQRVDRGGLVRPGDLRQTQDRPVGALAHELGIDGNELGAFLPGAERRERLGVGYQGHCRRYTPKATRPEWRNCRPKPRG